MRDIREGRNHQGMGDTCTPMFTAAPFTVARTWKLPKYSSVEEWIKKMWYTYTMEYFSTIKRNEIGSFVETWMNLETAIQSEVSKTNIILAHIMESEKKLV